MTDKEEKAIERCNELIKVEHSNWIGMSNQVAIETVLNLIQAQQEEIFKLQAKVDRLKVARENWKKTYKQAEKEEEKYKYLYQKALNNTIKADRDNLKKDKVIDEMANHIVTSDSNLCQYLDMTTKCKYYAGENKKTCDDCIKEYFINKVEKENKDE